MTEEEIYYLALGIKPNQVPIITDSYLEKLFRLEMTTQHPLRTMDYSELVMMREEDRRNHMSITGTTREGKSKFMEMMAREDIKRGYCVVFADPTDRGETAYNLLNWCVSQGNKKVVLIDPNLKMIPVINPLDRKNWNRSVNTAKEMFKLLFGVVDLTDTAIINDHMTSLFNVLLELDLPLFDALYFTRFGNPNFAVIQQEILSQLPNNEYALDLAFHLKSYTLFKELGSTSRRFRQIVSGRLQYMFGGKTGINFKYLIENGYTILVNLYPGGGMDLLDTRFLGVAVLLEVINAMEDANGQVCFYIDEAQRLINRGIVDALAHRQKTGFYMTLAHQYEKQFEDEFVRSGVTNLCKNMVMFHTPDYQTRFRLFERFFGSKAKDYADIHLSKQEALIKINKEDPQMMRVPNVQTPDVTNEEVVKFIYEHIFTQPWYQLPEHIARECQARYADVTPVDTPPSGKRTNPYGKSTGKTSGRSTEFGERGAQQAGSKEANHENADDYPDWKNLFMDAEGDEDSEG